jgi:aminopeptidase N
VIPVRIGLIGMKSGKPLMLYSDEHGPGAEDQLFVVSGGSSAITLTRVEEEPVPSVLRGFSAPVILEFEYSDEQLRTLLAHDTDPFNRWEAGQRLALRRAIRSVQSTSDSPMRQAPLDGAYLEAMRAVLRNPELDAAFKELVLTLPSEGYIAEQLDQVDPQAIHTVREAMRLQLARTLHADWEWVYETHRHNGAYRPDPLSSGRRALAGMALHHLCLAAVQAGDTLWPGKTLQAFKDASNMTDRFNALHALVNCGHPLAQQALDRFHALFKNEPLVLDKWFALQAAKCDVQGDVLPAVRQLLAHPDFSLLNPNRARSLIFSYCSANPGAFHRTDAGGYVFWSERVLALDATNPQVAARLARALDRWSTLAEPYRSAAREALARVAAKADLSNDVREVVSRALAI